MPETPTPTEDLLLYLADTNLACGIQYGLWVERSPSVEEQISLSSMSQDKIGHARAYYQMLEELHDRPLVEIQYDREPEAFAWNPAWTVPQPTWYHVVLAQALFSRGLLADARAVADGTKPHGVVAKIDQEEAWHTRHGDAWLERLGAHEGKGSLEAAFEDLWPYAVGFFGGLDNERFQDDVDSGLRTTTDADLFAAYLEEIVPLLEGLDLDVPVEAHGDHWHIDPHPSPKLVEQLREGAEEHALELVALLQDPEGREMAEL